MAQAMNGSIVFVALLKNLHTLAPAENFGIQNFCSRIDWNEPFADSVSQR